MAVGWWLGAQAFILAEGQLQMLRGRGCNSGELAEAGPSLWSLEAFRETGGFAIRDSMFDVSTLENAVQPCARGMQSWDKARTRLLKLFLGPRCRSTAPTLPTSTEGIHVR